MKTLSILLSATFAATALAGPELSVRPAQRIPDNYKMNYIHGVAGADGVIRTVSNGVGAAAYGDYPHTLVVDHSRGSGYWGGFASTGADGGLDMEEPICSGLASVDTLYITWCSDTTIEPSTMDIDINFYDNDNRDKGNTCSQLYPACETPGLLINSYTWVGAPVGNQDPTAPGGACWTGWVTYDPVVTLTGSFFLELMYKNCSAGVNGVGIIIDTGSNQGGALGTWSNWAWTNNAEHGYFGSAGAYLHGNAFRDPVGGGCWWWGCNGTIFANDCAWMLGQLPWMFMLSGDYGTFGPILNSPMNKVWMAVAPTRWGDPAGAEYNYVQVWQNPDTGETWGGLPFGDYTANWPAAGFDIYFANQSGYLSEVATGQFPLVSNFLFDGIPALYTYTLRGGDVSGDNAVNLIDLGAVLANYNASGVALPWVE